MLNTTESLSSRFTTQTLNENEPCSKKTSQFPVPRSLINDDSGQSVTNQATSVITRDIRKEQDVRPKCHTEEKLFEEQSYKPKHLPDAGNETLAKETLSATVPPETPITDHATDHERLSLIKKIEGLLHDGQLKYQNTECEDSVDTSPSHSTTECHKAPIDKKESNSCEGDKLQPEIKFAYQEALDSLKPFCTQDQSLEQAYLSDNLFNDRSESHKKAETQTSRLSRFIEKIEKKAYNMIAITLINPIYEDITASSELSQLINDCLSEYYNYIKELKQELMIATSANQRFELFFKAYATIYYKLFSFMNEPAMMEDVQRLNISIVLTHHLEMLAVYLSSQHGELTLDIDKSKMIQTKEFTNSLLEKINNTYIACCAAPLLADILSIGNTKSLQSYKMKMLLKSLCMWLQITNNIIANKKSHYFRTNLFLIGELSRISTYCRLLDFWSDLDILIPKKTMSAISKYIIIITAENFFPFSVKYATTILEKIKNSPELNKKSLKYKQLNEYAYYASRHTGIIHDLNIIGLTLTDISDNKALEAIFNLLISTAEDTLINSIRTQKETVCIECTNICIKFIFELINRILELDASSGRKRNMNFLFRLVDLAGLASCYMDQEHQKILFKEIASLLDNKDGANIKHIVAIAFSRILACDAMAQNRDFKDCTKNCLLQAALAGDHYSRVHCFLGLTNYNGILKISLLPGKICMLDMAMRLITYNASMENPDYSHLLAIQNRANIPRTLALLKLGHLQARHKTIDVSLMDALWQYETNGQRQESLPRKKEIKANQFFNAVIIYLTETHDNAMKYLNGLKEPTDKTKWLKGWIHQQLENYHDALAEFSYVTGNTADINKAECLLALCRVDDNTGLQSGLQESIAREQAQRLRESIQLFNNGITLYEKELPICSTEIIRLKKQLSEALDRLEKIPVYTGKDTSPTIFHVPDPGTSDRSASKKSKKHKKKSRRTNGKDCNSGKKPSSQAAYNPGCTGSPGGKSEPCAQQLATNISHSLPEQVSVKTISPPLSSDKSSARADKSVGDTANTQNLWNQIQGKLNAIERKYICADYADNNPKQENRFTTLVTKSGKTCLNTDKHLYQNFNTIIRTIIRKLKESDYTEEDQGSLKAKIGLISNILLKEDNAFLLGQNLLFDYLGWLLMENIELLLSGEQTNKKNLRTLYRHAYRLFLISTCNSIEYEVNRRDYSKHFTPDYIKTLVSKIRKYRDSLPIQAGKEDAELDEKKGAKYQFESRIICRITNMYHVLGELNPDGKDIRKPLMELREEIISIEKRSDKEARKLKPFLDPYTPRIRIVDTEVFEKLRRAMTT